MSLLLSALFAVCCAASLGMAVLVILRNPRSAQHRAFAGGALFLFLWLATLYVFDRQTSPGVLTWLGRLNIAAMLPVVVFAFLQVREVLRRPFRRSWLLWAETVILAILTLLTPLIDQVEVVRGGQHVTLFGPLFFLNILHVVGYLAAAVVTAAYGMRGATRQVRGQVMLVGLGLFAAATLAVTCDLALPYLFHVFALQEVGALSTVLYLGAVAYAISVHRLLDVRVIVRKTLVFALLLAFVLAAYAGTVLFLAQSLPAGGAGRGLLTAAGVLAIAFGFDPLRRWLEVRTDRFLFRQEHAREEALEALARDLTGVVALDDAMALVLSSLQDLLHPRHAAFYAFEPGEGGAVAVQKLRQSGHASEARLLFKELGSLTAYCAVHPEILNVETMEKGRGGSGNLEPEVLRRLTHLGVAVAVPILTSQKLMGLLLLGRKRSDSPYSGADIDLLEGVGVRALSSLQKARLFESDRTKSEFVSIAAHELLTPIAAVQGYLSMILDDHMGVVDERASGYLGKASSSIRRLQELVRDLLSVSRLEAGRISITPQAFDGVKLVRDALDQLAPMAMEKGLALTFKEPSETLPPVWADPGRTMEVLINLIGNAIKYTPQGLVTVGAELASLRGEAGAKDAFQVTVADTGLGMDREALAHLFGKFYRAPNAQASGIQGTGLGLYITKAMVEKMGGMVSVHSALGEGSAFTVTLPVAE